MKIFNKQNKDLKGEGSHFYGNWGEIPIGISGCHLTKENIGKNSGLNP